MRSRPILRAVPRAAATWPCGSAAGDGEGVVLGGDDGAAFEHAAQALDVGGGPVGQVAQGALTDLAVLAVGFAQQDGGGRVPVRDGFDIHGVNGVDSGFVSTSQKCVITWLRFGRFRRHFSRTSAGFIVSGRGKLGLKPVVRKRDRVVTVAALARSRFAPPPSIQTCFATRTALPIVPDTVGHGTDHQKPYRSAGLSAYRGEAALRVGNRSPRALRTRQRRVFRTFLSALSTSDYHRQCLQ